VVSVVHPLRNAGAGIAHRRASSEFVPSEIGPLPIGWGTAKLGEILEFKNGVNADAKAYGSGIPFANVLEVLTHSHLKAADIPGRVTLTQAQVRAYRVRRGDVLFNRTSETQEEVGLCSVYADEADVVFGGFVIRGRLETENFDPIYCGYAWRHHVIRSQIVALGQGAIRANIGQADLRNVVVPKPPLLEQRRIAATISDADSLIESLDVLSAKQHAMKQGAMRQLLSGQTRLPGFAGEWKKRQLGAVVADLEAGVSVNSIENASDGASGLFGVLKTSAVANGRFIPSEAKTIAPTDLGRVKLSPRADSVIISRMNTPDLVGECGYVPTDFRNLFIPDRLWMTRFREESHVSAKWLAYTLSTPATRRLLKSIATGTSGSMKNISKVALLALELAFPDPAEQNAIAEVVEDMDAEIVALESERAKAYQCKQGMMQELLTGRVRLI